MKCGKLKRVLLNHLFLYSFLLFLAVLHLNLYSQEQTFSENLKQSGLVLKSQLNNYDNSQEIINELSKLFNDQNSDIKSLRMIFNNMQSLVRMYSTVSNIEISELKNLLLNSGEIIKNLEKRLEIALDRLNDAEEGSLNLLNENIQFYTENTILKKSVLEKEIVIAKQITVIIILSVLLILILIFFLIKVINKIKSNNFSLFKMLIPP